MSVSVWYYAVTDSFVIGDPEIENGPEVEMSRADFRRLIQDIKDGKLDFAFAEDVTPEPPRRRRSGS
jgi:hypothetical protein